MSTGTGLDTMSIENYANYAFAAEIIRQAKYDDFFFALIVFLCGLAYVSKGTFWDRIDPHRYKLFEKPQQREGAPISEQRQTDLGRRLDGASCDIAILWASQSGTAERLAARLARELRKNFGASVLPLDVSDIDATSLAAVSKEKTIIIMASTYGEGDPSDNLGQMWSWLHQNRDNDLSNVRFLAFGLGNSKYKHYNLVINTLVYEMLSRGAQMLMPTGKADDVVGETEEHFFEWKQRVFEFFQNGLGYKQHDIRYEPSVEIIEVASVPLNDLWSGHPFVGKSPSTQSEVASLPVTESRNLLQQSPDRTCLHMEFDVGQHTNLKYKTGDHLAVWSTNPSQEVELLLKALGRDSMRAVPIHIKPIDGFDLHIPSPTTLESVLQSYVEICAPISRECIDSLATYAPTTAARQFLKDISHDKTSHAEYSKSQYLNLGRMLTAACPVPGAWASVPLYLVLEILPPMKPRSYSISSSSIVSPRQISVTVAVSDTTTSTSPDRVLGLATNYLTSIKTGCHPRDLTYSQALEKHHAYVAIRKSTFKLPIGSAAPIVMVGAGTGVAPFRGFVQERARLKSVGKQVGAIRLFFGCRNTSQDFLYADDFSQWAETLGECFSLTTALSRPEDGRKRYVQDAILEDAEAVCKLLVDDNAYFYICGSPAMARDVSTAVSKVVMARRGWSDEVMKDFVGRQKRQKRWLQDVWG
jgi:NADPH-ferrihemoprotein reductase